MIIQKVKEMLSTNQLYDLIEFRWNPLLKNFTKYETHATNVPRTIAYAKKKSLVFHSGFIPNTKKRTIRYKVVKNGEYQYKVKFK